MQPCSTPRHAACSSLSDLPGRSTPLCTRATSSWRTPTSTDRERRSPALHIRPARRCCCGQAGISALEGAVLTVDEPLLTPLAKRRAHHGTGALVVDMEGRWIADAAAARNVPLVGIRAVLDEARYPLPSFVATIIADEGRREWAHAVRAMSDPCAVRSFLPLALKSREAGRALQTAVRSVLPALVP